MRLGPEDDLQKALDAAEPGTLVELAPGEYRQKVMITTPALTLRGAGSWTLRAGSTTPSGPGRWLCAPMG